MEPWNMHMILPTIGSASLARFEQHLVSVLAVSPGPSPELSDRSAGRVRASRHFSKTPGRTSSGASPVPKHDSRSGTSGTIQRRADRAKYIWYFATHNHYCYQSEWSDISVNMKSEFELQYLKFACMKTKSQWRSLATVNRSRHARVTLQITKWNTN